MLGMYRRYSIDDCFLSFSQGKWFAVRDFVSSLSLKSHYLYSFWTYYLQNIVIFFNLLCILCMRACTHAKLLQLCPTLCDPMDCSPPGSSVHGIFQARTLEWVAISSSRGSSQPRDQTTSLASPALAGRFFTTWATWELYSNFKKSKTS